MSSSDAERTPTNALFKSCVSPVSALADLYNSPLYDSKLLKVDISGLYPDYKSMFEPMVSSLYKSQEPAIAFANMQTELASFQNRLIDAAGVGNVGKMLADSHARMFKYMMPSFNILADWAKESDFHSKLEAMAKATAYSLDNPAISELLESATSIREQLGEEELDELTDEFFETHPDLAVSLEQSPALYVLSKADRRLVVWFVGIIVTLYVGNALLNLGTDSPDMKAVFDAFGLDAGGGLPAGLAAAKVTDKALDKLPQEEAE